MDVSTRIAALARESVVFGYRIKHHRVWRPFAHLRGFNPSSLTSRRDEPARLPASQAGNVTQFGNSPTTLRGIAVLDAGMEKAHAAIHHRGPVVRIYGDSVVDWLYAGEDTAYGVGVRSCLRCSDASGDHGGWWHSRMSSGADDTAHVVHDKDAGD